MLYKSFLNDTILIQTQSVDGYLWLLALLLILSIFATTWLVITIIRLCGSYANVFTKRYKKLSSKKSVKRLFA
jgi:hypothetical protein